jgi:rhodanese-related sulfurtransferase
MIEELDREELKDGLADGSILLVDVREPHEFVAGHIPGSVSMPLSVFDPAALPETDRRIVFSCAAGVRSVHAIMATLETDRPITAHYPGGFKDWYYAGEEIEAGE